MKTKELTEGNWYNHNGSPVKLTAQDMLNIYLKEKNFYEPIPITAEWLLCSGFEEVRGLLIKPPLFTLYNGMAGTANQIKISIGRPGASVQNKCKYVHQLQNLYFALTEQELLFNKKTHLKHTN